MKDYQISKTVIIIALLCVIHLVTEKEELPLLVIYLIRMGIICFVLMLGAEIYERIKKR